MSSAFVQLSLLWDGPLGCGQQQSDRFVRRRHEEFVIVDHQSGGFDRCVLASLVAEMNMAITDAS